jgi:hypothetical protein
VREPRVRADRRPQRFAWVLIMGAAWETAAFITGALGAHDQQSSNLSLAHTLLFLLAPLWINAFAYMTFARMLHFYLPDQRIWRIRGAALAKYFVWADVLAFLVQAAGASITGPGASASTLQNGLHIYTAGIGLQEAFVLFFITLMIGFHRKAAALEHTAAIQGFRGHGWRQPLYALYGVLFVITVRLILPPCAARADLMCPPGAHRLPHRRVRRRRGSVQPAAASRSLRVRGRRAAHDARVPRPGAVPPRALPRRARQRVPKSHARRAAGAESAAKSREDGDAGRTSDEGGSNSIVRVIYARGVLFRMCLGVCMDLFWTF